MPYLNVTEVESALTVATSAPYSAFTELITLPNLTWENRQCHAIKIGNGNNANRPGVYFLGGVHAREWGSPDILINFVEQLQQAYHTNTGLTFGTQSFSAADIQSIVNTLDIFVFPQANPDGRNYSMTNDDPNDPADDSTWWRKNRRTQAPNNSTGDCVGVDVNRNYDFLWDFPIHFNPGSPIEDSTNVCDHQLYNGPSAFSEPESLNAKWMLDTYGNIGYFIDLHSYGQDILYSWGDDDDQTTNPDMNFQNAAYDGTRGILGDSAYQEYIPSSDKAIAIELANVFAGGISAVRGTQYTVKPSCNLYPTAGTSDDYAYSRHFVDDTKSKVISYTLEWGTEFIPQYAEMQNIIAEITSGLLAFCVWVRKSIERCDFIVNRSTFGQDEIDVLRNQPGGALFTDAFRVVVDGFSAAALGITGPNTVLNVASPASGITVSWTGNTAGNGNYGSEVQLFTFHYNIDFGASDSAFNFAAQTELLTLNVTAGGLPASAQIELIKQPDPFILHGDPTWLSVDLRVFVVRAGQTRFGVPMGNDASGAPAFIQAVMAALKAGNGVAGGESFEDISTDEESSSVYVYPTDGPMGTGSKVFNFALAKVHYIGLIGATNVRVFFRLLQAQSTSAAFEPTTSYRRAPSNPNGQPIPLPGIIGNEYVTIPCFAKPRVDSTTTALDQQTDDDLAHGKPINVQTIAAIGGPEVDNYFGCWLDINQPFKPGGQPNNVLPATVPASNVNGPFTDPTNPPLPIQQAILRNLHQCLIAEIAFDPIAIPEGKDPSNWDKLAQRNLAWSDVPNPGIDGSRTALDTFEISPTKQGLPAGQLPDELMIDWGNILTDTDAEMYLPAVKAPDILAMANKMYSSHRLTQLDGHTIGFPAGGITYIPVPPGTNINYAGLLSVNLPKTVRKGQEFNVVVRQLTNAIGERTSQPQPPGNNIPQVIKDEAAVNGKAIEWRRVSGAFQLRIPVKTKQVMLEKEERQLSVLRWIAEGIPHNNRWAPVFKRYLDQIGGRLIGLGGNPSEILPSPTGDGKQKPHHHFPCDEQDARAYTGKITGLMFDKFGDFHGFILDTEKAEHTFYSREREIKELAERVWKERLRITVWVEKEHLHEALSIIIHEPPVSFI